VAPRGTAHMTMLADLLEDEEMTATLPEAARPMFRLMVEMLGDPGCPASRWHIRTSRQLQLNLP